MWYTVYSDVPWFSIVDHACKLILVVIADQLPYVFEYLNIYGSRYKL